MAREWALAGVSEEELKPDQPIGPPKTPRGKWQNFWYHHKVKVLVITALAAVLAVLTHQMLSRNPPDYRLVLITQETLPEVTVNYLAEKLTPYGEDLDGDETVEILIENLSLGGRSSFDYQMAAVNSSKLTAYLASGDVMFFALEPAYYEERIKPVLSDGFEFFTALPQTAGTTEGGRLWCWEGSSLQQNAVLRDQMAADLCFGVRTAAGTASGKDSAAANEAALTLLRKLMAAEADHVAAFAKNRAAAGDGSATASTAPSGMEGRATGAAGRTGG